MKIEKIQIHLYKLLILFSPLDFFSFKIDRVDISFFKFFSFLFVLFSTLKFISELNNKTSIKKDLFIFSLFIICSIINVVFLSNNFDTRVFLNMLSTLLYFFTFIFSYDMIMNVVNSNNINNINKLMLDFKFIVKTWFLFIILSIPQVILFLFGINLSFENFTEYAPENQGVIFGLNLLRPNSLFGEPRSIAVMIIPIYFLFRHIKEEKVNYLDWFLILLVGALTQSSSFFIVLLISISLIFFSRSYIKTFVFIGLLLLFIVPNFEAIALIVPRIQNLFSSELFLPESFNYELVGQLGDISFVSYILNSFSSDSDFLILLFGNGLGTSSVILLDFVNNLFGVDLEIINSRFLFYTMIIDLGLIGSFLFIKILYKRLKSPTFKLDDRPKLIFNLILIGCLFTGSYLFLVIIPYILLSNIKLNLIK